MNQVKTGESDERGEPVESGETSESGEIVGIIAYQSFECLLSCFQDYLTHHADNATLFCLLHVSCSTASKVVFIVLH